MVVIIFNVLKSNRAKVNNFYDLFNAKHKTRGLGSPITPVFFLASKLGSIDEKKLNFKYSMLVLIA